MKLFVWDFHGTLEKGNDDVVFEISNMALQEFGFEERFTKKDIDQLAGSRWHQYFSYLLPKEASHIHLKIQKKCFELSMNNLDLFTQYVKLNDGAKTVLEAIEHRGHRQILISNTTHDALKNYINLVGIEKHFPSGSYFGIDSHSNNTTTKKQILENYLKLGSFSSLISIGDSPADIALAKLSKKGISYLYSYPSKPHRKADANYKVHSLLEILTEVNND